MPSSRHPSLITLRRGGTLTDEHHRLLALWAAACAEHVLHYFEQAHPQDLRPRQAIEGLRAWANLTGGRAFSAVARSSLENI